MSHFAMPMDPTAPETEEPFGQIGVRKFAARIFAWICVIFVAFCLAMSQRSSLFHDELRWRALDQTLVIRSAGNHIFIQASTSTNHKAFTSGWSYHSGYNINHARETVFDDWDPSIWKLIGFQFSPEPMPGDVAGFLLRLKWSFLAMLFALQPIYCITMAFIRWRKYRA